MKKYQSEKLCSFLKARNSHCEVVSPGTLEEITRQAVREAALRKAKRAKKKAKGSDAGALVAKKDNNRRRKRKDAR